MRNKLIIFLVVVMIFTTNISPYASDTYTPGTPLVATIGGAEAVQAFVAFVMLMARYGVTYPDYDNAYNTFSELDSANIMSEIFTGGPGPGDGDPDPNTILGYIGGTIMAVQFPQFLMDKYDSIKSALTDIYGQLFPGENIYSPEIENLFIDTMIWNGGNSNNKIYKNVNGEIREYTINLKFAYTSSSGTGVYFPYDKNDNVIQRSLSNIYIYDLWPHTFNLYTNNTVNIIQNRETGDSPIYTSGFPTIPYDVVSAIPENAEKIDLTMNIDTDSPLLETDPLLDWPDYRPLPTLPRLSSLDPGNERLQVVVQPDGKEQLIYDGTIEEYIQDVSEVITWEDINNSTNDTNSITTIEIDGQQKLLITPQVGEYPYPDVTTDPIVDSAEFQGKNIGLLQGITNWISKLFQPTTQSINFDPLMNLDIQEKFPFSLPWDLMNVVTMLEESPQAPYWELPIKGEVIVIDFERFDELATLSRSLLSVLWVVALIFITRGVL